MGIEKIYHNDELFAIIIRNGDHEEGTHFFTEDKHSFQVGVHNVKESKRYRAHISLPFKNLEKLESNKIYYIKKGKVGIDFYNNNGNKTEYSILNIGDLILFVNGGHGVDILEDTIMIEIKQGPYRGVEIEKKFFE